MDVLSDILRVVRLKGALFLNASRTVLAERFALLMDMPPMQYLRHWRLALAAHALRSGRLSLTRIAGDIGYESDAAFSRAFSRAYGMPPGAWRRKVDEAPQGQGRNGPASSLSN